jgi:uncharacterized protein
MPPTLGHGKICYLEMPATDIARSSDFYKKVFNWNIRRRGDGSVSFDDGVGEVSGVWTPGPKPFTTGSLVVYIMVDDMSKTLEAVQQNGGEIVEPVGAHHPEITAKFRDPAGNIFGIFQERHS